MNKTFNFSEFLIDKGFVFTNYGTHNLYEIKIEKGYFCVNLQGEAMTTKNNDPKSLKVDVPTPKTEKEAEKWLKDFLNKKL
nr:MAG TPA: hypothetical protein [Caudoviricetes sp.]